MKITSLQDIGDYIVELLDEEEAVEKVCRYMSNKASQLTRQTINDFINRTEDVSYISKKGLISFEVSVSMTYKGEDD